MLWATQRLLHLEFFLALFACDSHRCSTTYLPALSMVPTTYSLVLASTSNDPELMA